MADIFSVLERHVSRRIWATAIVATGIVGLLWSHSFQGWMMPVPKLVAVVLVAVIGGAILGGTYFVARRSEEAEALAVRLAKLDRMALSVAYSYKPPPPDNPKDDAQGTMFQVVGLASTTKNPGVVITNRPFTDGVVLWLECVVRNVGEERLEDISLPYMVHFFRGGHLKPETIAADLRFPMTISFLGPGDKYTFYVMNDDTLNLSLDLPNGAQARIYNEVPLQGVRVRRAPESNWQLSNAILAGRPLPVHPGTP